ncbi:oxygen-independent coproporphyrinogen-3 oxidase [Trinickia symbiotica]|uniref:Radical SAM protein n=1 Tax=Trinickia symbiotica TaxID=863227 RepID=A0A2N7X224_9BURK|nr:radical SAM protein [Trinickia symbiotica]PMS35796.1 radical SAM protein [Trinickia symbiotica]PPK44573.1 oxygen-independent coproporphyrinogen-3 oxidase [Trinickia symbiotica]
MNLLRQQSLVKFDRQFPIYNFFFPSQGKERSTRTFSEIWTEANRHARSRALYFHIPFCDTICNFCPFTRGKYSERTVIDRYFDSLLSEIRMKADLADLKGIPIGAIFFGGGTPSLLDPDQIVEIGELIRNTFDLSHLREFSFEVEVKSLTRERANAMREIGVTHPRFGLQTFSQKWRDMFDLTATLPQVHEAAVLLKEIFPFQTFDILYGMSGQDEEELISDLTQAVQLGTTNVDIYPIDNIVTQVGLHAKLAQAEAAPTSAMRKFSMNVLVDQFMRHAGFMPHNGHGYVRAPVTSAVVSDDYSFVYHEHVYGYHDFDLMGFGVNAISSTMGHVTTNTHSRNAYSEKIAHGAIPCETSEHDNSLDYARPLVLRLAYHGHVEKPRLEWHRVHPEVIAKLDQLKQEGLVTEDESSLSLTKLGWYWYVDIMYFLMPKADQLLMNALVAQRLQDPGRSFTKRELLYPVVSLSSAATQS